MSRAHIRSFAVLVALALLVACSAESERVHRIGEDIADPTTTREGRGRPDAQETEPRSTDPAPGGQPTSRAAPPPPAEPAAYLDNGPVGSMGRHYLGDDRATRLIVEIDYVQGETPRSSALQHVEDILRREADKPRGVQVVLGDAIPRGSGSYTYDEIADLEARHREHRSSGTTATMWVVYLDGQLDGDAGTLGVAYRASTAALFPDQMNRATTSAVTGPAIERAVLTHEVGHLLGLVNLVYSSPHDREDPRSPGHSTNEDSVMVAAIEDLSIALLDGGPPDDFDSFDRDDLAGLREGRL